MPGRNLQLADDFASEYDKNILKNNWTGPQIIFDLTHELLSAKSYILDLGIGTGESSIRFQNKGHTIVAMDGSSKMLEQCKIKNIGSRYINHDIETSPYPFENKNFDAVISNGVFHLIYPLEQVFEETCRILKPHGIFAFTYENMDDISESSKIKSGIWECQTASGVFTYKYSEKRILKYLNDSNFKKLNQYRFLAFTNNQLQKNIYFNAIVARLQ